MATFRSSLQSRATRLTAVAGFSLSLLVLAGCANQSASGSVYNYGQAQQEQIVRYGTVVSVRPVTIQTDKSSGIGALGGAALGGVAGNTIGGGKGQILTTIGGALLGGLAGNAVENQVGKTQGLEITVRLDNGETRVIAQANDIPLSSGQRVQVISGAGPTRVVPM
ncbi:glycine zipper 2TM domain-containing protein [Castellaniella sp. MT123]|uniref:glycine zipper 2TM domain-containing protein n=1 Tax=Castellaniella sp. MT123 TaxID=3140381 RepID=UPI0031F39751|nr:glycine zipper 2TM domain-containing protein [Castellaniella sp.]